MHIQFIILLIKGAMEGRWPYREANYDNMQSIISVFPELARINTILDPQSLVGSQGIIIRSANDDNVHKAIKYRVWTTTHRNKSKLDACFEESRQRNTSVFLFFSVVRSGMFEGVARLKSSEHNEIFPYWWDDLAHKFKGYFQLEWVFLKDINYKHFTNIYNVDKTDVTKCKDCDIVDTDNTIKMIEVFQKKQSKRWIFNDFAFMDDREKNHIRALVDQVTYGQEYQQQYYNNYAPLVIPQQVGMMSFPPQAIMRPPNGAAMGFKMNPVSNKYKKK